jgi:hypothetical protein
MTSSDPPADAPPENTAPASSPISLAKAEDFNRWPGEWPEGVPKAFFPWVYPKYAEPESSPASKQSCSESAISNSWSCGSKRKNTFMPGELFTLVINSKLNLQRRSEGTNVQRIFSPISLSAIISSNSKTL